MLKYDNSLYVRNRQRGPLFIILYVDDLVIGGENLKDIEQVKTQLSGKFEMKDMNELHYFLGMKVIWTPNGILLTQRHYILNILFKFDMAKCKPISTPLDCNLKFHEDSDNVCEPTQYRKIIVSLIYLTINRPDLSYPIGLLSQFIQTRSDVHLNCENKHCDTSTTPPSIKDSSIRRMTCRFN